MGGSASARASLFSLLSRGGGRALVCPAPRSPRQGAPLSRAQAAINLSSHRGGIGRSVDGVTRGLRAPREICSLPSGPNNASPALFSPPRPLPPLSHLGVVRDADRHRVTLQLGPLVGGGVLHVVRDWRERGERGARACERERKQAALVEFSERVGKNIYGRPDPGAARDGHAPWTRPRHAVGTHTSRW